jgi:aryl-alcohol dehydrogenase-like predicted oxidoreductase
VLPACARLGLRFVAYFPPAPGLLTGKYRRGEAAPAGTRLAGTRTVTNEQQFDVIDPARCKDRPSSS